MKKYLSPRLALAGLLGGVAVAAVHFTVQIILSNPAFARQDPPQLPGLPQLSTLPPNSLPLPPSVPLNPPIPTLTNNPPASVYRYNQNNNQLTINGYSLDPTQSPAWGAVAANMKNSGLDDAEAKNLKEAMVILRDTAKSTAEKEEAKKAVSELFGKIFDEDLKKREKQVEELKSKIAKLEEQIDKRRRAKDRLVELRIELLVNESEGLGFPEDWQMMGGASSVFPGETVYSTNAGFGVARPYGVQNLAPARVNGSLIPPAPSQPVTPSQPAQPGQFAPAPGPRE